jgi:hypothetical protein
MTTAVLRRFLLRVLPLALVTMAMAGCGDSGRDADGADGGAATEAPVTFAASVGEPWASLPDFDSAGSWLDRQTLDWTEWEPPLASDPLALLLSLGIQPLRDRQNDWQIQNPADFHFIDFTGDGVLDVVYSGPTWWLYRDGEPVGAYTGDAWQESDGTEIWPLEGNTLVFYQTFGRHARALAHHHGEISRIWRDQRSGPLSFRTVHFGCCGDSGITIEYFRPVLSADTVRFQRHHQIFDVEYGVRPQPDRHFPLARHFVVASSGAVLRASPANVETARQAEGGAEGNTLAEYGEGARGFALADAVDDAGTVWWYVVMDGRTAPTRAVLGPNHGREAGAGAAADQVGWMDSARLVPR